MLEMALHPTDDRRNRRMAGTTETDGSAKKEHEDAALCERMAGIRHKVLVLSGKGGVGKSSVAAVLAIALARKGKRVGVLDIDIHGPSIPRLLDVEGERVGGAEDSIRPVKARGGISVMSIGLLLRGSSDAVIWRGPLKYNVIKQLLRDVEWGELDYLIVDSPPGTGDEPLSVAQLIPDADGALIVTTPQTLATDDVRRSIGFTRQLNLPVLGVVENMSGFVCPGCGESVDVFGAGGGAAMADEMGVPFLGRVPIDADMVAASDIGALDTFLAGESPGAGAFLKAAEKLTRNVENLPGDGDTAAGTQMPADQSAPDRAEKAPDHAERVSGHAEKASDNAESPGADRQHEETMSSEQSKRRRIAVPTDGGRLAQHFGHCSEFMVFEAAGSSEGVTRVDVLEAPPHRPGLLPGWLGQHGVDVVIAGGMGQRAQELFRQGGIEVVIGARSDDPSEVARMFVDGELETGPNICDH
jgi:Mrp family chromosome partitioning ATPase/predicted Fe-Mo cluster-binding NifX family protein